MDSFTNCSTPKLLKYCRPNAEPCTYPHKAQLFPSEQYSILLFIWGWSNTARHDAAGAIHISASNLIKALIWSFKRILILLSSKAGHSQQCSSEACVNLAGLHKCPTLVLRDFKHLHPVLQEQFYVTNSLPHDLNVSAEQLEVEKMVERAA